MKKLISFIIVVCVLCSVSNCFAGTFICQGSEIELAVNGSHFTITYEDYTVLCSNPKVTYSSQVGGATNDQIKSSTGYKSILALVYLAIVKDKTLEVNFNDNNNRLTSLTVLPD